MGPISIPRTHNCPSEGYAGAPAHRRALPPASFRQDLPPGVVPLPPPITLPEPSKSSCTETARSCGPPATCASRAPLLVVLVCELPVWNALHSQDSSIGESRRARRQPPEEHTPYKGCMDPTRVPRDDSQENLSVSLITLIPGFAARATRICGV
ncbi:hypothetical protein K466DRAFT_62836 [Polyporus arcularius HHB13444]|uniref:Uncharacterized protein n=1 Tax=Polyporus arcularius HHB13444 TaxID=1314778 RepID=A0A5C3PG25_9APHY|nr:hypothetical protein K466DRAFT_62836 [Polyporus arcularius HHB13444]